MKTFWNYVWWALAAFVLVCGVYSSNARGETELYLGAWSKHFNSEREYNESHNLVGINYKSWVAGRLDNSYDRETWFVGYDLRWSYKGVHAGVMATVTRGYTDCFGGDDGGSSKVCFMPLPYIGYDAPVAPKFTINHEMVAIIGTVQF